MFAGGTHGGLSETSNQDYTHTHPDVHTDRPTHSYTLRHTPGLPPAHRRQLSLCATKSKGPSGGPLTAHEDRGLYGGLHFTLVLLLLEYYLRRRSPGPPFPPDHRQAGERGDLLPAVGCPGPPALSLSLSLFLSLRAARPPGFELSSRDLALAVAGFQCWLLQGVFPVPGWRLVTVSKFKVQSLVSSWRL